MAEPKETLYRNWIKAGLGLLYVKEGIQGFIVDEINSFHTGVLGKFPGAPCTFHTIQNVLSCPTWGICSGLPCRFHDNTDPGKTYTLCLICDAIRNELKKAHRYGKPSYKNTTAQRWCTTSWELAKCFMPATGYSDKNTADDTDLSGLISVILNHKDFQNQITEQLVQPGNKFEKVRKARNDIMHNAKMETPTTDLNSYFNILNDVLNDSKHLQHLTKVNDAKVKLHQLQSNLITITTEDEQMIRKESLKALENKKEECIFEIDNTKENSIKEIGQKKAECIQEIGKGKKKSVQEIATKKTKCVQEIDKTRDESIQEIDTKKVESVQKIDTKKKECIQEIDETKEESIQEIDTKKDKSIQEIYKTKEEIVQEIVQKIDINKEESVQEIGKMKDKSIQEISKTKEEIIQEIDIKKKESNREGVQYIDTKKANTIQKIEKAEEESVQKIDRKKEESIQEINRSKEDCVQEMDKMKVESIQEFGKNKEESIKDFEKVLNRKVTEGIVRTEKMLEEKTQAEVYKITEAEAVKRQQEERRHMYIPPDKEYEKRTNKLKEEIVDHYLSNGYCVSSIPVLVDGDEVHVDDFFMMPKMKLVKPATNESNIDTKLSDSITSIHGLFLKDNKPIRKACIVGEAGQGKTTLCQQIISSWCTIHTSGVTAIHRLGSNRIFDNDDKQFLKSFKFICYIPLRNHQTSNVIEMIKNDLIRKGSHDFLNEVLDKESESCLVILDGLDEWMPGKGCTETLPYLDPREKFSVLITTRPWKLEVLRPKQPDIGQEIELIGILDNIRFVENMVKVLDRKKHKKKATWDSFFKHITLNKIENLIVFPLLLTQIICMWYDDIDCGYTQAEFYCEMIDYLFNVAERRQQRAYQIVIPDSQGPIEPSSVHLLCIFKNHALCQKYGQMLMKLSELAYHTLFNEERENALVFPHSLSKIHNLTETDVQFCLTVGLLSQAKFSRKVTSLSKKLSFPHKSFQEFFAAMYIANLDDACLMSKLNTFECLNVVLEMSQVFIFLSGMRTVFVGALSRQIAELADKDERVLKARRSMSISYGFPLCDELRIRIRIQRVIFDCIKEGYRDGQFADEIILHDVLFSRNGAFERDLLRCINTSKIKSFVVDSEYLNDFDQFLKYFDGQNMFKLSVSNASSSTHVNHITRILKGCLSSLKCLQFKGDCIYIFSGLQCSLVETMTKLKHLTSIGLEGIMLKHCYLERLAEYLSKTTQLVEINLQCITCENCPRTRRRCNYNIDLLRHEALKTLVLRKLGGHIELGQGISLTSCELANVNIGQSVVKCLTSSSSLHILTVHEGVTINVTPLLLECTIEPMLNKVISDLKSLRALKLVSVECFELLSFSEMKSLKVVAFCMVTMTSECIQCMVDSMPQTNKEIRITMRNVKINLPDDEMNCILVGHMDRRFPDGVLRKRDISLRDGTYERDLKRCINTAKIKSFSAARKYILDKCMVAFISNDTSSLSCQFTCKP